MGAHTARADTELRVMHTAFADLLNLADERSSGRMRPLRSPPLLESSPVSSNQLSLIPPPNVRPVGEQPGARLLTRATQS